MLLADITKEAVDSAILEYDQLGADAFLSQYGFAPAKRYPSKAIASVAHKYIDGGQHTGKRDTATFPVERGRVEPPTSQSTDNLVRRFG